MSEETVKVEIEQPVTEIEAEAREVEAEASAEAVETVSEAAVEIAEIEANRDVAIAEINADVRVAESEAFAEAISESEDDQWRRNIEAQMTELADSQARIAEGLSSIQQALTPPPPPPNPEPESGEVVPPAAETEAPPETPKRTRKFRWI